MNRHLDDEQIAAAVAGDERSSDVGDHLGSCLECRQKVAALEELIRLRRRTLVADEPDWEAQREAVLGRLPQPQPVRGESSKSWLRPLMAAAAAMIVVAVVGLMMRPEQTEIASNGADIAVEEILAEVDELLADDSIPGFEVIDPGVEELEGYMSAGTS